MPSDFQIKQFELPEQDALLSFLHSAYPEEPRKSDPVFWKWHHLENPYTDPQDIPLWVVKSGNEIVGQMATIPVELKVGSRSTGAIWILDFIVDPRYRGQGLGKRLALTAREKYPTMITLGINEQSTAVFRKLNWVALDGIHRYQKLLFPGHDPKPDFDWRFLRSLANFASAPFRPRPNLLQPMRPESVRVLDRFDDSFEALWQEASKQWPVAVARRPRFLEWQFGRQPGKKFEVLGCFEQERLAGYAVLFFRKNGRCGAPPKAAISDLCYSSIHSDEVIEELLKASLRRAVEKKAGSLVTDGLDSRVERHLRRWGFWQIKKSPRFMASAVEDRDLICDPKNWFLTRGDSDVSIFELPNL